MLLMDLDHPGEVLAVRRIGDDRHIRHEADTYVSQYTLTGGSRYDYYTAEWEFWGDLMPSTSLSVLRRSILLKNVKQLRYLQ